MIKRTCDRCIVVKFSDTSKRICHLGYERKLVRIAKGLELFLSPEEECPKPTTWALFFDTPEKDRSREVTNEQRSQQ